MRFTDGLRFALQSVVGQRTRFVLVLLAMAVGVAAVVVLTGLGEAARRYVLEEFRSLGTNLVIVLPGRSETAGGPPPIVGETPRDLTIDDAMALTRHREVKRVAPVNLGAAPVSARGRERECVIIGSTHSLLAVRNLRMGSGRFLPPVNPRRHLPVCVIGENVREALFDREQAVGRWVRIGDRRFRVAGVLGSAGRSLGLDLQDMVVIPVASAQMLFDTESLFRVLVEARSREDVLGARVAVIDTLRKRHRGEEDVTVITQDAVLSTFDGIFQALTMTVGGIASISLAVAGILIMNVLLISVSQRAAEIGLLKALGAPRQRILLLFLWEAAFLSSAGGLAGLAIGQLTLLVARRIYPLLLLKAPWWAVIIAIVVAIGTGVLFGLLPARRAARLDPVVALAMR